MAMHCNLWRHAQTGLHFECLPFLVVVIMKWLSDAPVWLQVIIALSVFVFAVLPVVVGVVYLLFRLGRSLLVAKRNEFSRRRGMIYKVTSFAPLILRLLGVFVWLLLISIWMALPLGLACICLFDFVLGEGIDGSARRIATAFIVSAGTCWVVEFYVRRMESLPVLWRDLLSAFPEIELIRVDVLVNGARVVVIFIYFVVVLLLW